MPFSDSEAGRLLDETARKARWQPPAVEPRALLVEDDQLQAQINGLTLVKAGFHVKHAATGTEALRLFREYRPHVVVVDLGLPDVSGAELVGLMRAAEQGPRPKIVVLTASGEQKKLQDAMEAGADDVYSKGMGGAVMSAKFGALADDILRDADSAARLARLEKMVLLQIESQAEVTRSLENVRTQLAPMQELMAVWDETKTTVRVLARVGGFLRRTWLIWLAFGAGLALLFKTGQWPEHWNPK